MNEIEVVLVAVMVSAAITAVLLWVFGDTE